MTVAELIDQLSEHNDDTPVRVVVEDEFGASPAIDVSSVNRVVSPGGPTIEIVGSL